MPRYEFACPNGHSIEEIRMLGDIEPPFCDECGEQTQQVIGKGIRFFNNGGAAQTRGNWN